MDKQVIEFCNKINSLPGLKTYDSCSGHGKKKYYIAFTADKVESIFPLSYAIDPCHSGVVGWKIIVSSDCSNFISFVLTGPINGKGQENIIKII